MESRADADAAAAEARAVVSDASPAVAPSDGRGTAGGGVPDAPQVNVLGVPIRAATLETVAAEILCRMERGEFVQHGAVNTAKLVYMQRDGALREAVLSSDIITADGMGVVLAARLLGTPLPERVAGVDLFLHLVERAAERGYPIYLLGGRDGTAKRAAAALQARFPGLRVAGTHHGFFWADEPGTVARIRESGARLLFVGITSPLKEEFLHRWREQLGVGYAMGVGGSFDILAGHTRRAPAWVQRIGLEWLYRTAQEPRRLWRRYFFTNLALIGLLIRERWKRALAR